MTAPLPTAPAVRRLNRAVPAVAALILLVTLFVVVFLSTPLPPPRAGHALPAVPLSGGAPGFLRTAPAAVPPAPAATDPAPKPGEEDPLLRVLRQDGRAPALVVPHDRGVVPGVGPVTTDRATTFQRALRAPLAPPGTGPVAVPGPVTRIEPAAAPGTVEPLASLATAPSRWGPPPVPGTVPAGTVIPARLLTAVDSSLPGPLLAQVTRDVYDAGQVQVVIPRGTRLIGQYENQVAAGQRRLLVAWTRLQRPDGATLEIGGLPATDEAGAAGLPAHTDDHLRRAFGDAILLSLLGAGAQLSQPPANGFAQAPTAREVAAAALGQELSSVGLEIVRRDLAMPPTLRVPAATAFDVFVTHDLTTGGRW